MQNKFERISEFLQCPQCRQGHLLFKPPETFTCAQCGTSYPIRNGILHLLADSDAHLEKKAFGKLAAKSYDLFAARGAFRKLYRWRLEDEFEEYTRTVEVMPSDILCDVGCGTGNYTLQFAKKLPQGLAIGIDISRAMLELLMQHARAENHHNVVAVLASAENLPFKDGSIHKVFNGCLHHLFPHIQPSLAETHRCLGVKGIFFGSTFFAAQAAFIRWMQQVNVSAMASRPVIAEVLAQELANVGFRDVVVQPGGMEKFFFGTYSAVKNGSFPAGASRMQHAAQ